MDNGLIQGLELIVLLVLLGVTLWQISRDRQKSAKDAGITKTKPAKSLKSSSTSANRNLIKINESTLFSERLEWLRKRSGLSRNKFSALIFPDSKCSSAKYHSYEHGTTPNPKGMDGLCRNAKVDPQFFTDNTISHAEAFDKYTMAIQNNVKSISSHKSNYRAKIDPEIGKRIRNIRTRKGIAVRSISEYCGVTENHIYKIELAKDRASEELLRNIAEFMNVPYEYLLIGAEHKIASKR